MSGLGGEIMQWGVGGGHHVNPGKTAKNTRAGRKSRAQKGVVVWGSVSSWRTNVVMKTVWWVPRFPNGGVEKVPRYFVWGGGKLRG